MSNSVNDNIKQQVTLSVTVIFIRNGIGDLSPNPVQSEGDVEYAGCISAERLDPQWIYDTKQHLMKKIWHWSFEKCEVLKHCHYSQFYSDPKL